ncbi:hypothetical protein BZA70DRAFT_272542 [Myxozyma melibiosi]|uniref:RING-type E3 ubiquitin transferase n=1 Tax=Myxozyma melibiosi TaxID=54550 RepID=A0ABR1FDL4_9ASCO
MINPPRGNGDGNSSLNQLIPAPSHMVSGVVEPGSDDSSDNCAICLCPIPVAKLARTLPCRHIWDLPCILQWLEISPENACPLCKTEVTEISFEYEGSGQQYITIPASVLREDSQSSHEESIRTRRRPRNRRDSSRRRTSEEPAYDPDLRLEVMRRQFVYRNSLRACHIGTNSYTGFTTLSPGLVGRSLELQSRARAFIRRELLAFPFLLSSGSCEAAPSLKPSVEIDACRRICYMLQVIDIQCVRGFKLAVGVLSDYLGPINSSILIHELCSFLRSPCRTLAEYDDIVQYKIVDGVKDAASRRQRGEFGIPLCQISREDIERNLRSLRLDVLADVPDAFSALQMQRKQKRELFRRR